MKLSPKNEAKAQSTLPLSMEDAGTRAGSLAKAINTVLVQKIVLDDKNQKKTVEAPHEQRHDLSAASHENSAAFQVAADRSIH